MSGGETVALRCCVRMSAPPRLLTAPRPGDDGHPNPLLPLPALGDNAAMPTESPKAEPPKCKRRRFQFRLRTLMIGVPLLGLRPSSVEGYD
jgi:hypothetical protein